MKLGGCWSEGSLELIFYKGCRIGVQFSFLFPKKAAFYFFSLNTNRSN